ncbi:hypothetical protein KM043_017414 [Ampulex compressa]|nr:hypothetical protein KM043_017414 [Ampulex compressa]
MNIEIPDAQKEYDSSNTITGHIGQSRSGYFTRLALSIIEQTVKWNRFSSIQNTKAITRPCPPLLLLAVYLVQRARVYLHAWRSKSCRRRRMWKSAELGYSATSVAYLALSYALINSLGRTSCAPPPVPTAYPLPSDWHVMWVTRVCVNCEQNDFKL